MVEKENEKGKGAGGKGDPREVEEEGEWRRGRGEAGEEQGIFNTPCSCSSLEQRLIAAFKTKMEFRVFRLGSSGSLTCRPAIDPLGAVL